LSIVESVGSASTPTSLYSPPATAQPSQTMTAQDFMQLLIAQLKNQDPSQPMDSAAMVQQTTELGMMQSLSSVQSNTDSSYLLQMQTAAADLIGKTVTYNDASGVSTSGLVSSVSFHGSTPTVTVNGGDIDLSRVLGISSTPTA
jgi:flagellar basal-body rod modification protein FlgD